MLDPGLPTGKAGIRCRRRSSFADAHRQHHAVAGYSGSRGGGGSVNSEKDVCCIASTQTNAERLMNTAPTLSRDKDRTIVGYNSFCLAGNFVDRNTNQNGSGVRENASFTLNTQDRHAVAYDARNNRLNGTVSGTLQAKESGGMEFELHQPGHSAGCATPAGMDRAPPVADGVWTIAGLSRWMGRNCTAGE